MADGSNSPEMEGNIIKFPAPDTLPRRRINFPENTRRPPQERNALKRALLAGLALLGIGVVANKVAAHLTQPQSTPIVASKDKPSLPADFQPTPQPYRELRINNLEAERRWKEFEKDPEGFMKANPDLIIIDRQAGPNGLNMRTSPGANNDRVTSNFAYKLEPHTQIPSLGIKIGHDADGDWVITIKADGTKVYYNLDSTELIPPQERIGSKQS